MHLIDDEWKDRRCAAAVHPGAEAAAAAAGAGKSGEAEAADDADAALLLHDDVAAALVPPLHAPLLIAVRVHCRCIIADRVDGSQWDGSAALPLRCVSVRVGRLTAPADRRRSSRKERDGWRVVRGTTNRRHALKRCSADVLTDCTAPRPDQCEPCAVPHRSPLLKRPPAAPPLHLRTSTV